MGLHGACASVQSRVRAIPAILFSDHHPRSVERAHAAQRVQRVLEKETTQAHTVRRCVAVSDCAGLSVQQSPCFLCRVCVLTALSAAKNIVHSTAASTPIVITERVQAQCQNRVTSREKNNPDTMTKQTQTHAAHPSVPA